MPYQELTEEQRDKIIEGMIRVLGLERKHPSKHELEVEIIDYLGKKQPCSLCTCGADGMPHVSVVDYMNDGLMLYIMSEGGRKFHNIQENNRVAVGIGTSTKKMRSIRGLNIWGIADVFTDDTAEFVKGLGLFKPVLDEIEKLTGKPAQMPKGIMRLIRVTPQRMVYFHYNKGIGNATWESGGQ
jgi:hypothetical protein